MNRSVQSLLAKLHAVIMIQGAVAVVVVGLLAAPPAAHGCSEANDAEDGLELAALGATLDYLVAQRGTFLQRWRRAGASATHARAIIRSGGSLIASVPPIGGLWLGVLRRRGFRVGGTVSIYGGSFACALRDAVSGVVGNGGRLADDGVGLVWVVPRVRVRVGSDNNSGSDVLGDRHRVSLRNSHRHLCWIASTSPGRRVVWRLVVFACAWIAITTAILTVTRVAQIKWARLVFIFILLFFLSWAG